MVIFMSMIDDPTQYRSALFGALEAWAAKVVAFNEAFNQGIRDALGSMVDDSTQCRSANSEVLETQVAKAEAFYEAFNQGIRDALDLCADKFRRMYSVILEKVVFDLKSSPPQLVVRKTALREKDFKTDPPRIRGLRFGNRDYRPSRKCARQPFLHPVMQLRRLQNYGESDGDQSSWARMAA